MSSSYIDHITEFLFDEKRRLSSKAAVVVFGFMAIILIDNVFGISYFYNSNKKIEQVQKLNTIIKDTVSDSTTKIFAIHLRSEIIERECFVIQFSSVLRNIKWKSSKIAPHSIAKESSEAKVNIIRSNFWFHVTAGGIYYLIAIVMLPVMVFNDKKTSLSQRIATGLLVAIVFLGFGIFFYWLCNLIPQVSSTTWIWNYFINATIQFLLIGIIISVNKKKK